MNEEPKIPEIKQPVVPIKPAAKAAPQPALQAAEKAISPLAAFSALVDKAPKEHLPTMLVKLANKCISEKVFATGKELADAIVGASKVK